MYPQKQRRWLILIASMAKSRLDLAVKTTPVPAIRAVSVQVTRAWGSL